ncbi:hypothetical protein RQP46_002309 [Phenoliferia psychrophenolica]
MVTPPSPGLEPPVLPPTIKEEPAAAPFESEIAIGLAADTPAAASKGPATDFGFLPIPEQCRYDPAHPFVFSMRLNAIFAIAATITVSNLYYSQPVSLSPKTVVV